MHIAPPVALQELLGGFGLSAGPGLLARRVTGISADSRTVRAGDLFVARAGAHVDGRGFIDEAVARGATAIVREAELPGSSVRGGIPVFDVPDLSRRAGLIADRFFRHPSRQLWIAGVTGTNGKTTVTYLLAQALQQLLPEQRGPARCGLIGTLGWGAYGALQPATHTTPDAITLQRQLAAMVAGEIRHCVMEVSSHALDQGRVEGVAFDTAVFTNLSRDHLDYHRDIQAYADAKRRLFQMPGLKHAVVNLDDPVGRSIRDGLTRAVRPWGYSLDGTPEGAVVRALRVEAGAGGLHLQIATSHGRGELASPLLGRFNAANLLAAVATLLSLDQPLAEVLFALAHAGPAPGRMERLGGQRGQPLAVVDFAHTPDALGQVLATLRPHCAGRLICVFGCGGERDAGKRPLMGRIAELQADRVVLTDDNPRGEDGDLIIAQIRAGMVHPEAATVERDRARALALALDEAGADDVVLVAGKGHEDYQEVAGVRRPFSDGEVLRTLLGRESGPC